MKSALALVLLAATTASIGCGGSAISVPSAKLPVVQTPSPQPPPACNPPNTIIAGVCTAPPPAPSPQPPPPPPAPIVPAKHYTVIDLAPLPGDVAAQAQGISNGRVVGWSIVNGVSKAVVWENGTVQSLGLGVAYAVNNLGDAAGYVSQGNGIVHATSYSDGTVSDLLALNGFNSSIATGVNDAGEVVGVSFSSQDPASQSGFTWTQATGMQAIPGAASASAVNSAGDVAGTTQDLRAAIFTSEGTTINLGTLGDFSLATSVNDNRHAVGYSPLQSGGQVHAFFYNGSTLQDLGSLQNGDAMVASSLNNSDIIVGTSNLNGNALAWVWSATTGIEDLNTLISPDSGWVLTVASGVDVNGRIVGAGVINGAVHGFLLTPD